MSQPLRVVVLQDGDVYVAQCIEIDISAQGSTEEEALTRLTAAMRAEEVAAKENGRKVSDIGPAPEHFQAIYDTKVVSRTELKAA